MISDFVTSVSPHVVRIDVSFNGERGNGTGLVIDDAGTIFTCEHVIRLEGREAESIKVIRGSDEYAPTIVKADASSDIAILRAPSLRGRSEFVEYDSVKVGEECFILGYPLHLPYLSLSKGTISAKGRRLATQFPFEMFQVDARINFGNSGGPVYQATTGKVIGIVTAKYLPFLTDVDELRKFVRGLPQVPTNSSVAIGPVNFGGFFNYVNDAVKRISDSLMKVQVGIGWVIPIQKFLSIM